VSDDVAETTDDYGHRVTIGADGSRTTELDPITIEGDPNPAPDPRASGASGGGGADAGTGDGGADGGPTYLDPEDYSTGPTLSDGEKEALWTVGAHVVGEIFEDISGLGPALHTITMESDNPQAMEAQRDREFEEGLQEQTDDQRNAAMTESLQGHTVPMDAGAVPEQDEEVFQP
jgi:hypothetical protein